MSALAVLLEPLKPVAGAWRIIVRQSESCQCLSAHQKQIAERKTEKLMVPLYGQRHDFLLIFDIDSGF